MQYFVYKPCVEDEGAENLSKNNQKLTHGIDVRAVAVALRGLPYCVFELNFFVGRQAGPKDYVTEV